MELFESMMLEHRKLNESGFKSITVEFSDTGTFDAPVKDATYSVSSPDEAVQEFLKDNPKYNSTAIIQIYDEDGNAWYIDENDNNSIKAFDSLDEFFDIKPDINLSLDASGQSVGFLGGKGGTVENEAVYQEDLPEDISEIAIAIDPDSDLDYSEEGEDGNIIYYFISPDLTEDEFISAAKVLGFEDTHSPTEILWEKSDGTQIEFYDDSRFGDPEDPIGNGFTIYGAKKVEESVKVSESKKIIEAPRGCRGPGVEMFDEFVLAEYYYLNPSDQKYIDKSWDEEVDDAAQAAAREANNYSGEMKDGRHWTDFVEEVGSLRDLWTKRDEIRKRVKDAKSSGEIVSLDNLHNSSSLEDLSRILNEYGIDNYYSERLGMIELGSHAIPWGDLSSKDLKNVYDYIENEVYEGVLDGFQLDLDQDEEYGDSVIIRKENLGESVKVNESKKITEAPDRFGFMYDDEVDDKYFQLAGKEKSFVSKYRQKAESAEARVKEKVPEVKEIINTFNQTKKEVWKVVIVPRSVKFIVNKVSVLLDYDEPYGERRRGTIVGVYDDGELELGRKFSDPNDYYVVTNAMISFVNYFDEFKQKFYEKFPQSSTESIKEDTIKKKNGKWTNRGDDGKEHGEFDTKKEADAQRKAMFANGYKGEGIKKKVTNESIKSSDSEEVLDLLYQALNKLSDMSDDKWSTTPDKDWSALNKVMEDINKAVSRFSKIKTESVKLKEGYSIEITTQDLMEISDRIGELVEMMDDTGLGSIKGDPNTYGIGAPFIGTYNGYIDLSNIEKYVGISDEDEYGE